MGWHSDPICIANAMGRENVVGEIDTNRQNRCGFLLPDELMRERTSHPWHCVAGCRKCNHFASEKSLACFWRRHLSRFSAMIRSTAYWLKPLAVACFMLSGCVSGPRGAYFDTSVAASNVVIIPRIPQPRVGIVGILVEDREDKSGRIRSIHTDRSELPSLLMPFTQALRESSKIHFSVVGTAPMQIDCSLPDTGSMTTPENAPCKVSDRVALPGAGDAVEIEKLTHLLLVIGWSARTAGDRTTTWGIGPGTPAVTVENNFSVYTKVSARLFDLQSGALLTDATAIDGGGGSYGVMLTLIPYFFGPTQSTLLEATSRAVGAEVARRLLVSDSNKSRGAEMR